MVNPTQNGVLKKDDNGYPVMGGTASSDNATIINSSFDSSTRKLLVLGTSGGSPGIELPTGTVDGANTTFVVTNTPRWLSVDGISKFDATNNPSNPGWSYAAGTITILDGSPPTLSIVSFY